MSNELPLYIFVLCQVTYSVDPRTGKLFKIGSLAPNVPVPCHSCACAKFGTSRNPRLKSVKPNHVGPFEVDTA